MFSRRTLRFVALMVASATVGGCAKTTVDSTVTEAPALETATTLPSGPAADLLPRLVIEAGKLSEIIGADGRRTEQLLVITNLFDAVRPELAATDGLVALDFDGALGLCKSATKYRRPADADKCFKVFSALTDNYLAKTPAP